LIFAIKIGNYEQSQSRWTENNTWAGANIAAGNQDENGIWAVIVIKVKTRKKKWVNTRFHFHKSHNPKWEIYI